MLSQSFEEDLHSRWSARVQLPAFFSNLLPEGKMRRAIAREVDVNPKRELPLLTQLGEDLPGAVCARPIRASGEALTMPRHEHKARAAPSLRFALSGAQPKLSTDRNGRQLVIPVQGTSGHWIAKLPMEGIAGLTRWENAMMDWAAACDFDVPAHDLIPIGGVPPEVSEVVESSEDVFMTRRFDRPGDDARVHFEDLAQVNGLYPTDKGKYRSLSYPQIARIVGALCGEEDQRRFAARLVFVILSGNGDAHAKNWALWYPDGRHPRLAPVYDQIPTVLLRGHDRELALNLTRHPRDRRFDRIGADVWLRFCARGGIADGSSLLHETIDRVFTAWSHCRDTLTLTSAERQRIGAHWRALPLLWDHALPAP